MAGSVNKVILVGHLGKDPDVRNTQDGGKIINMTLATSESWNDRGSGERRERTEWHRVCIFNEHLADVAERFLKKGNKVYIEGALQTRKWTDQQGQERYTTEVVLAKYRGEIVLLERNNSGDDQGDRGSYAGSNQGGGRGGYSQRGGNNQRPPNNRQGGQGGGQGGGWSNNGGGGSNGGGGWDAPAGGDLDDEIPF